MINAAAFHKLTYGLFILSARSEERDNACIINTAVQVADKPKMISVAVNKANLTHDMIDKSGVFDLSVLSEDAPFSVFERFGFQSGRDSFKFDDLGTVARSENGVMYITRYTNAVISCKVIQKIDCSSHTLFLAEITEAKPLSDTPSMTYAYYFANVKPKPPASADDKPKKKGFVCRICGYVHEGETLPEDFVCPICKHGAEDFEPL